MLFPSCCSPEARINPKTATITSAKFGHCGYLNAFYGVLDWVEASLLTLHLHTCLWALQTAEQTVWAAVKCFWKNKTSVLFETHCFTGKDRMNPKNDEICLCPINFGSWSAVYVPSELPYILKSRASAMFKAHSTSRVYIKWTFWLKYEWSQAHITVTQSILMCSAMLN